MRWSIKTINNGNSWYAEEWKGDEETGSYKIATNLPGSLLNKINAMLNFIKTEAGYKPTDDFIECLIRPKGIPENEGQRHSKCLVVINFRDGHNHKQLFRDHQVFIVTNQEYDTLSFV